MFAYLGERDASLTRADLLPRFLRVIEKVWGKVPPRTVITVGSDSPRDFVGGGRVLASLVHDPSAKPLVVGDFLVEYSRFFMLLVADELLSLDDAAIDRVLIHEAVHMGHYNHGTAFRARVAKHGGAISEDGVERGPCHIDVEFKVGARYKVVRAGFCSEPEAIAWAREEAKRVPGRYRLSM